jgi:hypothetical protein
MFDGRARSALNDGTALQDEGCLPIQGNVADR